MRTFCFTPTTAFLLITLLPGSGVERVFSGAKLVGLLWLTVSAFLRITTNRKLLAQRLTLSEAADMVDSWLQQPNIRPITPGDEDWTIFRKMIIEGQVTGALISDAQLAAVTIENGGVSTLRTVTSRAFPVSVGKTRCCRSDAFR